MATQRMRARASTKCSQCRARKLKCNETRPSCQFCREHNFDCHYKQIPRPPLGREGPPLQYAQYISYINSPTKEFIQACEENNSMAAIHFALVAFEYDIDTLTHGLNKAVGAGNIDLARQLIEIGATWDSGTVFQAATSLGAIKMLIAAGFDVNTALMGGTVLLLKVIRRNDVASISFLLEHGADPNLGPPEYFGENPAEMLSIQNCNDALNFAARFCTPEVFALLLSHGAKLSNAIPLHYATIYKLFPSEDDPKDFNHVPMLEYLIGLGLDINSLDDVRNCHKQVGTPLQYAVRYGRVEEARWLLQHGADPNKLNNREYSARDQVKHFPEEHEMRVLLSLSAPSHETAT